MNTLPIRAPHLSQAWVLPGFERVAAVLSAVIDVYAEAQSQMRAAEKRYGFVCE